MRAAAAGGDHTGGDQDAEGGDAGGDPDQQGPAARGAFGGEHRTDGALRGGAGAVEQRAAGGGVGHGAGGA